MTYRESVCKMIVFSIHDTLDSAQQIGRGTCPMKMPPLVIPIISMSHID